MKKHNLNMTAKELHNTSKALINGAKIFSFTSVAFFITSGITNNANFAWFGLLSLSLMVYSVLVSLLIYARSEFNVFEVLTILPCMIINFALGWIAGLPALIILKIMSCIVSKGGGNNG